MGEADKQRARAAKAAKKAAKEANKLPAAGGMAHRRHEGKPVVRRPGPLKENCRKKRAHPGHMHTMNGTRYECPGIAE